MRNQLQVTTNPLFLKLYRSWIYYINDMLWVAAEMSHRRMQLALSLVFILCGLFNSIFSEKQQHSQQHANLVLLKKISAFSQKMEAHPKAFAQELFKALIAEDPKKNIIFSPVAMTITLATLSLGIKSTMSTNHPKDLELELKLLDAHKCLHHLLHLGRELVKQKQLKHQDILFLNSKMMANQMLLHQISKLQKMDIQMIDFSDTEKAKKAISHHVAERTHTKITDLITDLNPETILCLVNHIFFKGILKRAFQPNLTQKEDFFLNDKTKVQVDMMRKTEQMLYSRSEELFATMVKMPFKGNVSLILMLPDAGHFDNALKKLTAKRAKLQKTSNFRLVHLTLPKFKITFEINFKHLLPKINLKHLLPKIDPKHTLTTTASSQDVTLKAPLPNLEALHQVEIELSEHALTTDTAIHTDNLLKVPVNAKEVPVVVKFNRPFLLFVEDEMTQTDLFVGQVLNPQVE
ncbi:hypothetical protein CapIbe_018037 [Capra ibex]